MPTMRHLLLFIVVSTLYTLPARGAAETNSNANPEYNDYDEEEPPRSPGNLEKSTPKPLMPYFDQGQVIVYVLPNAQSVKLDCPVKNYDALRHAILWYRNDTIITNGEEPINKIYSLDKKYSLTLPAENATGFNFSCRIMPIDVRRNITVQLGSLPNDSSGNGARLAPSVSWIECIIFAALALFHRAAAAAGRN